MLEIDSFCKPLRPLQCYIFHNSTHFNIVNNNQIFHDLLMTASSWDCYIIKQQNTHSLTTHIHLTVHRTSFISGSAAWNYTWEIWPIWIERPLQCFGPCNMQAFKYCIRCYFFFKYTILKMSLWNMKWRCNTNQCQTYLMKWFMYLHVWGEIFIDNKKICVNFSCAK